MIWKHKTFLKLEAIVFFGFLFCSSNLASLGANSQETPKGKPDLPLDAFQTRTLPLAKKYFQEGEFDKSKNLLETLLELDPQNSEAHLLLGQIFIQQKNYERAATLLKESMHLTKDHDAALKANAWLKSLPPRYTKPKAPEGGHAAPNVETAEDDRELGRQVDKSLKILFFTADWLPEANSLAEEIKETVEKSGVKAEIEPLALDGDKNAKTFKEYSISLLPAIVVLKHDGHFAAGQSGSQIGRDLKSLLRQAK